MRKLFSKLSFGLVRDERGVSAVEFALIAPIMVLFLFGSADLSLMLTADRKVTQTASTVADLVAQDDVIGSAEMADIFTASQAIMQPYDTSTLQMRVSSVVMDNAGKVKVAWSQGRNMSPRAKGSSISVPNGLLQKNTSVIFSEVKYAYKSAIGSAIKTDINMQDKFYLRPRRSKEVAGP